MYENDIGKYVWPVTYECLLQWQSSKWCWVVKFGLFLRGLNLTIY